MIADVVGNYLETLSEREFDAPFMALLRALGFYDIHMLHGAFEFGKDFIAKRNQNGIESQFAFQTKAGDIGLSDWNGCRGQIDMLRTNALAHPAFDRSLRRLAVFVTTGRLIGGAALEAQSYSDHLRTLGEIGFTTWERGDLVDLIGASPEVGLVGSIQGALLVLLGQVDQGRTSELEVEEFSRRWLASGRIGLWKAVFEAAVLANRLRQTERLDLACYVALCLIRAAWASTHGLEPPDNIALIVANTGRSLFRQYASAVLNRCSDHTFDPIEMINANEILAAQVTYPIRCLRLVEVLGLLGLLDVEETGIDRNKIADFLLRFYRANPGAAHPISDRWAVSLIPPILLLARTGHRTEIPGILENVIKWICDHYDSDNLGLAGPSSTPIEEVEYLLGSPFEHITLHRRPQSYAATVVLDIAALLHLKDVFELARNDFLAVQAMPPVLEVQDSPGQYILGAEDAYFEPNMEYENSWIPKDGWKVAPHHTRAPDALYLERVGRPWDHLGIGAVLRDRHFLCAWRYFISA